MSRIHPASSLGSPGIHARVGLVVFLLVFLLMFLLMFLLIGLAGCRQEAGPSRQSPPIDLRPGQTVTGKLTGTRPAVFRVALRPGEYLHATLEQQGVDAVITLAGSGNVKLLSVDSPNGERGPEHLFFVAGQGGSYSLEARAFEAGPGGPFTLRRESRPASPLDRIRAAACRALSAADAAQKGDTEADAAQEGDVAVRRAALGHYREAIAGWRRAGEGYQEALTENKLGKAYSAAGDSRAAALHLQRALGLFGSLGIASQEPALRNDLGMAYERLGQIDAARSSFEIAGTTARRQGNRREATTAINNLGILEQNAGEPWKALQLLEEALAGWREMGDERGKAATLHNLGTLYTVLGKLAEARESLEEALGLYRASGARRDEAATTMALGWVRFLEGDAAAARAGLLSSLDLRRAAGDRRGEAVSLDRLGSLSRETGELDRAVSYYRQTLAIHEELGDLQGKARTLSNLGETLTAQGDPAAGLRHQNLALQLLGRSTQPSTEAYALFRRARAEQALGRLEAAWTDMQEAIPRLESIRERAGSDDFRMAYFDSVHEQYELAVDLLMELHEREPGRNHDRLALEMSERARARGLLDLVHEARGRRTAERLASSSGRLHRLDEEIRAVERARSALATGEGRAATAAEETRVRRLLRQRDKVLVESRQAERGSGLAAARPLGAEEIRRRLLDPGTVMLVYFLGERRSFVWAVSSQGVESAALPPRALVEAAAARFHSLLARSHLAGTEKQLHLTAAELSAVLLGKVAHRLEGKRVVVVTDGALAYVPFGALPDPADRGRPMIERHEIVVVPSASVLAATRARAAARPTPRGLVAAVADPVFSRDDPRVTLGLDRAGGSALGGGGDVARSVRDLGFRGLDRLPFSGREAAAILALAGPERSFGAKGFDANLALVTGGRLEGFRIVHFATHALVHPRYPELSGVVLSLVDERGRPRPGFLRSYQIFSLHLPAELVVLSACRTGLGLELHGEGLVGLTQSFFHAGASRVVVSLWDVADEATAQLMERFYRELLRNGRPPAEALRTAQLSMRGDPRWSAPYHWAGFVLQGD